MTLRGEARSRQALMVTGRELEVTFDAARCADPAETWFAVARGLPFASLRMLPEGRPHVPRHVLS
jgi:hypothetical protein